MRAPIGAAVAVAAAALLTACGAGTPPQRPATAPAKHRERAAAAAPPAAPRAVGAPRAVAVSPGLVEHGSRTRREVALTFDADMTAPMRALLRSGTQHTWIDHALFDELRAQRVGATIFLTGLWTATYPDFVRGLAADPRFELENHSLDHAGWEPPCYGLPLVTGAAAKRGEVERAAREIERVAGVTPRYFRFPGGCESAADRRLVASLGERPIQWDVISGDAFLHDPAAVVRTVLSEVRPGSIVIAHCIGAPNTPATAAAFAQIVPRLRAEGYRLVTLRTLLRGP